VRAISPTLWPLAKSSNSRVALVTGGAAGVGAAIASQLAAASHRVIVSDLNLEAATQTAKTIEAQKGAATPMALDVGNQGSIERCFGEVERRFGRCDILVNNAGIAKTYPFLDYPLDHWLGHER
jgi:3-oxoacyl-[acyl-carrier protein] reductase